MMNFWMYADNHPGLSDSHDYLCLLRGGRHHRKHTEEVAMANETDLQKMYEAALERIKELELEVELLKDDRSWYRRELQRYTSGAMDDYALDDPNR
jgi:hypothetical protein